jgi:hypothetical protein
MSYIPDDVEYYVIDVKDFVIDADDTSEVTKEKTYAEKVKEYIENGSPALAKIRNLDELTQTEKDDLDITFNSKLGSPADFAAWSANKPLLPLLRVQVGIADEAIQTKFGSFMNAMKKALGITRGEYGSEQLASIWNELFQKGKISQRDFEKRVKSLMADIEQERTQDQKELQALRRKDARAVNKVLRENPVNTFFDDLALDPRTVTAARKKEIRAADQARAARRRATVKRSRARRR